MSLGFYVDLASCIGCKTCQVACKDRRDIRWRAPPAPGGHLPDAGYSRRWRCST